MRPRRSLIHHITSSTCHFLVYIPVVAEQTAQPSGTDTTSPIKEDVS